MASSGRGKSPTAAAAFSQEGKSPGLGWRAAAEQPLPNSRQAAAARACLDPLGGTSPFPDPGEHLQPGRGHSNRFSTAATILPPAGKAREVSPSQRGSIFLLAEEGSRSLGSLPQPTGLPFPHLQMQISLQSMAALLESPFAEHRHPGKGEPSTGHGAQPPRLGAARTSQPLLALLNRSIWVSAVALGLEGTVGRRPG